MHHQTVNRNMPNLRLLFVLALTAICIPASAQNQASRRPAPGQFPGGLRVHQVDYEVDGPSFAPQAGAAIVDDSGSYFEDPDGELYLDDFDPGLPADCSYSCPAAWTVEFESLFLNREGGDRFTVSQAFALSDFDYESGFRVTVHRHFDCLEGWDVTYAGGIEWIERGQVAGAGLNSVFGAVGVDISTFDNATQHTQSFQSTLDSIELTRKWYGWDVFAVGLGVRYLNVEEEFLFSSVSPAGAGTLGIETNNNMGGVQLSLEMKIPIGAWTTMTRFKGGLFGNAADAQTLLTNAGTQQLANSGDDLGFGSIVEFGYYQRYRVTENISLQGGYEFWWLSGLAVAPDQVQGILTPATGSRVNGKSDTWYHGATFGVEVIY
jgi:hypothetical protein